MPSIQEPAFNTYTTSASLEWYMYSKSVQKSKTKLERTRKFLSCVVRKKTPGSKDSSTSGLSPRGHLERQAEFHASTQDEA